jgi:hypothetical protein
MTRDQLLQRLERGWTALTDSYAGLSDAQLTEPGVAGDWSVKDMLAHVTTWEQEALTHLPTISAGGRPPKYVSNGGLDGFNAQTTEPKRALSLADVLRQLNDTHRQLLDYIAGVPDELFATDTRFRHRLRLDTYSHYPLHAEMIRAWREAHNI